MCDTVTELEVECLNLESTELCDYNVGQAWRPPTGMVREVALAVCVCVS